eukprot:TRINITY_DN9332_c0_g1_i2.p1 TRINITY_DN9332_c0_g1~~TRINITY_DN9332_c0_g1_i2.p1  ORF type:complete len:660 (-),score=111.00 TRINITY_DN9332_c0_g1_i2:60-2039(-)
MCIRDRWYQRRVHGIIIETLTNNKHTRNQSTLRILIPLHLRMRQSQRMRQINQELEYKGEPSDQILRNGPVQERSCTDAICCVLFVAFIGAMCYVAAVGYNKGDPQKLATPFDPDRKACGNSSDPRYEGYPYIYYVSLVVNENTLQYAPDLKRTVCVRSCPYWTDTESPATTLDCVVNSVVTKCNDDGSSVKLYPTKPVLGSLCLPTNPELISFMQDSTRSAVDNLSRYFKDIKTMWWMILIVALIGLAIGFIYMCLLRFFVGALTWIAIAIFIFGFAILGILLWERSSNQFSGNTDSVNADADNASVNKTALRVIAIVLWVLASLMLLIVICNWRNIRLVIAVMKAAADFIQDVWGALLVPPVMFIAQAMFQISWIISAIYIYSLGEVHPPKTGYPFGSITLSSNQKGLVAYHLFGFFWINAFLISLSQFIIASSAGIWYFSKDGGAHLPVTISIIRAFKYHLGSLAFGSLILSIVQFVRFIFEYIHRNFKDKNLDGSPLKFCMCCIQCCLACFERIIRFINNHAFIQIALTGKNFCAAASDAVYLILRNALTFGIIAGLGNVYTFLGKVFIAVASTTVGYLIITRSESIRNDISSPIPLMICFAFVTYTIGALFMSVWSMAADSILQCFFVDTEVNNGTAVNCPPTLREFVLSLIHI